MTRAERAAHAKTRRDKVLKWSAEGKSDTWIGIQLAREEGRDMPLTKARIAQIRRANRLSVIYTE